MTGGLGCQSQNGEHMRKEVPLWGKTIYSALESMNSRFLEETKNSSAQL